MAYPFRPQKEHNKGIKEPKKETRHILRKAHHTTTTNTDHHTTKK
jgi:hypothetical protein